MAKILIVDDEPLLRKIPKLILEKDGNTIEEAGSLQEATQMLVIAQQTGEPFNVVLSDTYETVPQAPSNPMGLDLGDWIKKNAYPAKMVLQSGFTENHFSANVRYQTLTSDGIITAFVGKPYDFNHLKQAVANAAALAAKTFHQSTTSSTAPATQAGQQPATDIDDADGGPATGQTHGKSQPKQ